MRQPHKLATRFRHKSLGLMRRIAQPASDPVAHLFGLRHLVEGRISLIQPRPVRAIRIQGTLHNHIGHPHFECPQEPQVMQPSTIRIS